MITGEAELEYPTDIVKNYIRKKPKFSTRYSTLFEEMQKYVNESGYADSVRIDKLTLMYALVDYFDDIDRLKKYHKIQHVNSVKIASYTAYWLWRRRPIQIKKNNLDVLYVNEYFIAAYLLDFLSNKEKGFIPVCEKKGLEIFTESLLYFLKYRQFDAKELEIILLSFFAGRIYQAEADITDSLPEDVSSDLYDSE